VFDVCGSKSAHNKFKKAASGCMSFLKNLPKEALVVMETTGYYHYRLAPFLCKQGVLVSVVNLL
jgi:transposase